jgi:subtilase family serine protease
MTVDALSASVDLSFPGSDINSDGAVDILWRNTSTGQNIAWLMNGAAPTAGGNLLSVDPSWKLATIADFNNDGQSDLLWNDSVTGEFRAWYMDHGSPIGSGYMATMDQSWKIAASGDMNGDGKSDILWSNQASGALYVWYMQDLAPTSSTAITVMPLNWQVRGTGDFNNDGHTDLLWTDENAGNSYVWYMEGATPVSSQQISFLPPTWRLSGTGDFNDDGDSDLLWWDSATGLTYTWFMDGATPTSSQLITTLDPTWKPMVVDRGGKADLTLTSAVLPTTVNDGEAFDLGVTVYNRGSKSAAGSTVQFYVSSDETLDSGDMLLGTATVGSLRSGHSRNASLNVTYDMNTMGSGAQNILMVVDHGQEILESNETNNQLSSGFTANLPTTNTDLTVQNVVAPTSITAGQAVTINATVTNQGADSAPGSTLSVYLSQDQIFDAQTDQLITSTSVGELAAGASSQQALNFTYSPTWAKGSQFFYVVADSGNQIIETNEDNNTAIQATTVSEASTVDLVIKNPQLSSPWIIPGNALTVSAQVANLGSTAAGSNKIRFYVSDDTTLDASDHAIYGQILQGVAAGGTSSVQSYVLDPYPSQFGIGTKYVLFVADNDNTVAETNEANNMAYLMLDVRETPPQGKDLSINSRTISKTSLKYGESLTVSADVINQGSTTTTASQIGFYISNDAIWDGNDQLITSLSLESLQTYATSSNKSYTFDYLESYGSGKKYLLFVADPGNNQAEFDETNNVSSAALTVFTGLEKPDLVATNLSGSTNITPSDVLEVNYTLENIGDDIAVGPFDIYYYISDNETLEYNSDKFVTYQSGLYNVSPGVPLNLGFINSYSPQWGTGTKFLLVVVDPAQKVTESDELNNISSFQFQING